MRVAIIRRAKVKQILLATGNPGKLRELTDLLADTQIELLHPRQLDIQLEVAEIGDTYTANALLKARAFQQASNLWTLADDSGLEVEALEGAPGLHSARLAGPGKSDKQRRTMLLEMLQDHAQPWTARFRCVVVLVGPKGEQYIEEGLCPGQIIPVERGQDGFGYDPIFLLDALNKTMAELSMHEKNQLSHRARAINALLPRLRGES